MALPKELTLEGNISYKEKYFSLSTEKRIRRVQFFYRMLIPGVALWLFLLLPATLAWILLWSNVTWMNIFYIFAIFQLFQLFVVFKYYPVIVKKRAHDFWKEWKIESLLLVWSTALIALYNLYAQYLIWSGDIAWLMAWSKYALIVTILNSLVTLLWLYLLFRPWTKWENKYGEQKYNGIKFFG